MMRLLAISTVILLSGCAVTPVVLTGIGLGSVAVNETTGRTVTDHAVSAANGGQDCRVGRAFKSQDICQTDNVVSLQITTTGITPSSIQEIESKYR